MSVSDVDAAEVDADASDLRRLAYRVLDRVESGFASRGIALPERRYVAVGETAHDCEQVTVSLQQVYLGLAGDQAQAPLRCESPRTAVFLVEVVRAVPAPGRSGSPSVEALSVNADAQLDDAAALIEACASLADQFGGVITDVSPGEPRGAMQAMSANVVLVVT